MSLNVIVAGVGHGLGAALARKFSNEGCRVAMLARTGKYLSQLTREICSKNGQVIGLPVDLTDPNQVARAFNKIRSKWGHPDVLIYNASEAVWKSLQKINPQEFEHAWRVGVFGAFLCSREAAQHMVLRRSGTIIFTGATSSVRGRRGAVDFSSAKFGLRGLAESLARELWPKGIHVAHVVLDGMIDTPAMRRKYRPKASEPLLQAEAIAETFWSLVLQKSGAWSAEVDLRPFNEEFFV
jgi:NAD(P)-dependent dehydrogenase (short-subunit alcohol dehydrogenase family)